jgi:CRISPR-associated endonuclease/helicase Cas3
MFARVRDFLRKRYPDERVNFHLLHGHALLSEDYQELRLAAVYDDAADVEGHVVAETWFTPKKRALLSPFGVGTIDQALLAVLQTKHVFVRLFGLANKTVVLDEVHAYDVYMSTLLERLLAWLASLGCSVVLLSATLPRDKRIALLKAFAGRGVILPESEPPYPRMLAVDSDMAIAAGFPATRQVAVQLQWVGDASLCGRLTTILAQGGCVAVICNTVGEAQRTYGVLRDALRSTGIEVELFHARFPFGQRDDIEKRVLARFGKEGQRPHAAVLVATQVIEQSLDLDFDLMVSEYAPVDLLLQRVGRLHRHQRDRPTPLVQPQLWLLEPGDRDQAGAPRFGKSEYVYERHILLRSFLALEGRQTVRLPDDVEMLIEMVYGDEPLQVPTTGWQTVLDETRKDLDERRERDQQLARRVLIKPPDYTDDLLEDFCQQLEEEDPTIHPTLQALTRLGDPTVAVVCLHQTGAGLRLRPGDSSDVNLNREPALSDVKQFLRAAVSLNHRGVVQHLLAQEVPAGWRKSGLLRYHRVAAFDNGALQLGGYLVGLDAELGVTISRKGSEVNEP